MEKVSNRIIGALIYTLEKFIHGTNNNAITIPVTNRIVTSSTQAHVNHSYSKLMRTKKS